ncbi:MAG: isochorismatase family protein [Acidimicrobiia bacterium]
MNFADTVNYDSSTALVVVDVQNDFADHEGSLYVKGAEDTIPLINKEIARAKQDGALVVYTADWHPERTPHFAMDGGIWPVHCVAGTWGAEFHPDLVVDGPVVHKGSNGEDGYSGFTMQHAVTMETLPTELERILRTANVERIVLAGLATDYCVRATALDGLSIGFRVQVLTDAVRAVDLKEGDGERALAQVEAAGGELI